MQPWIPTFLSLVAWVGLWGQPRPFVAQSIPTNLELGAQAEQELKRNILPFWLAHAPEPSGPGFVPELSESLRIQKEQDRGALLTSRILWTFSESYRRYPDPSYLAMAQRAFRDLARFEDRELGGYVWSLRPDGSLAEGRKQMYGHAFAIYGLSVYYRATGESAALERAKVVYRLIEAHSRDRVNGGYLEAFTRDWKRPPGLALSLIGPEFPKSQNTHLHLMEAYASLLRVWPDPGLREDLKALVALMLDRILSKDQRHLGLYFDAEWQVQSDEASFGHDIEAAWLLTEAAEEVGDSALKARVEQVALKLADATLSEGLSPEGGIYNLGTPKGLKDARKEWWAQAEAVVGFFNAYQLSGDSRYREAALKIWHYIGRHVVDTKGGEWFWMLDAGDRPVPGYAKIGFWKCPYHNGRACMELAARCRKAAAL